MTQASRRPGASLLFLVAIGGTAVGRAASPEYPVVAGFERFSSDPASDGVRGGLLLLGELNCTSCHKADATAEAQVLGKQAPILDGVGGRIKPEYLKSYLADPAKAKPGTTMPHALAGLEGQAREEAVEALVHFLAGGGAPAPARVDRRSIRRGEELYRQVGCAACHGQRDDGPALTTSVPLPDLRAKYTPGGLTAFLADPHKVRPSGRMPSLNLEVKEASAVANYLLRGLASDPGSRAETKPNLRYRYYEGEWDKVPDFAALQPKAEGESVGFDLKSAGRDNGYALRFEGFFRVDAEDDYSFFVTSDDGGKIWVDDKDVADSDGIHPAQTGAGKARLKPGMHKVVVGYFDGGGQTELSVEVESRNMVRQPLDPMMSLTDAMPPPDAKSPRFEARPELVAKGRALFSSVGCASCHELHRDDKAVASTVTAPDLKDLTPNAGCLAASPPRPAMHFGLSERQRGALDAALAYLAKAPAKPSPAETIARTMTAFNCYACHARGGVGGVEEARNAWFEATYADLGDEGRLPPHLDGVGAKLAEPWLDHILRDGAKDRPYMKARMPKFGGENVGHLTKAFGEADPLEPDPPVAVSAPEKRAKAIGRQLVGTQAFGCVQCHNFRGEKSAGIPALDMTIMTRRLRHDWFVKYVVNPQAYRPGTRMPSAWPEPRSQLADVLDGSSRRQIEAVWTYLGEGESAAFPIGIGRQPIPLVADKEAVIYRNFIEGAGPRAIGVGYPEKANLAYDANDGRIALIWQGSFIDASRHWTGRGEGFQPPMGDNVVKLPTGPSLAVLKDDQEAWPAAAPKGKGFQFKGYRLGKDGRPTFLLALGAFTIQDTPDAVAGKDVAGLRRTLTVSSATAAEGLWYRAAVGAKIEASADGWYAIDGDYKTRVEAAAPAVVRQSGGHAELLVPVKLAGGSARLIQHYQW